MPFLSLHSYLAAETNTSQNARNPRHYFIQNACLTHAGVLTHPSSSLGLTSAALTAWCTLHFLHSCCSCLRMLSGTSSISCCTPSTTAHKQRCRRRRWANGRAVMMQAKQRAHAPCHSSTCLKPCSHCIASGASKKNRQTQATTNACTGNGVCLSPNYILQDMSTASHL